MKVKTIIDEDFVNYKKPSMFIATSKCDFKCDKECGKAVCQNSHLATAPNINVDENKIAKRFFQNPITEAVVVGGLEPFDTFKDLIKLIEAFCSYDKVIDFVIYTGYMPQEIILQLAHLRYYMNRLNIIIKIGRFKPDNLSHFDEVLGVELASPNQMAIVLKDLFEIHKEENNA